MPRKKDPGSLTGSKRVKDNANKRVSSRAKKAFDAGADLLKDTASNTFNSNNIQQAVSNTANAVTGGIANVRQQVTDIAQLKQAINNQSGFEKGFADIEVADDYYGGLQIPEFDTQSFIPSDLTNPTELSNYQLDEKQLQETLRIYGGANRYLKALQAGYKHIEEVGKTKQGFEKARQSIIKGATEEVKTAQTIVSWDTERINLETSISKRDEANERLKQQQVKTLGAVNETNQLMQLVTAKEAKRDANIQKTIADTERITSKYLEDSAITVEASQITT